MSEPSSMDTREQAIAKLLERAEGMYAEAQKQNGGWAVSEDRTWYGGYAEACRDLLGDIRSLAALPDPRRSLPAPAPSGDARERDEDRYIDTESQHYKDLARDAWHWRDTHGYEPTAPDSPERPSQEVEHGD
jgi:hypothetical protein